ncbi:MAG: tetratricopeptide repeat protein [Desulfatibacillum sp.]|nr:tetratricopeptide repeat protein [Desulfatibacillum sp.]
MRERSATILCALCLGLLSLGLFWHVAFFKTINLDDPWYLVSNQQVNQGLSWQGALDAFGSSQVTYWHPMATLSAMADFTLFGPYPGPHHLSSLFFHAMAVILFFLALKKMTGALWPSTLAALLFAVHPVNLEAFCWLTQRKTILTGFFGAGTLLTYAYYAAKPGVGRYLGVFFLFALCVMSKPSATPLPLALLLLDFWPLCRLDLGQNCGVQPDFGRASLSWLILEKVPLLFLSLGTTIMTFVTGIPYGGLNLLEGIPLLLRLENALLALVTYLGKFFYSAGPTVYVPFPSSLSIRNVAGALLVLFLVTAWVARNIKKSPHQAVGLLWFLLCMSPVIGVIQVGFFPAWADRYAYLPFMGLYMAVAWTVHSWIMAAPRFKKWIGAMTMAWVVILGLSAWGQSRYWANDRLLFSRAICHVPESMIVQNNYAVALIDDGLYDKAIFHYRKALSLALERMDSGFIADIHFNLGNAYLKLDDMQQAEMEYKMAIQSNPRLVQAYNNLGLVLKGQGLDWQARACFEKSLEIDPGFPDAKNNLEDMAQNLGAPSQAAID